MTDDAMIPAPLGLGRRLGRALLLLVMYPLAGLPVLAGIAAETAVIAWVLDGLGWFGALGFNPIFAWALGVQAGLIVLFTIPGLIAGLVTVLRTGEMPE